MEVNHSMGSVMGPKTKQSSDEKEFENSGEAFQSDLDDLYGLLPWCQHAEE